MCVCVCVCVCDVCVCVPWGYGDLRARQTVNFTNYRTLGEEDEEEEEEEEADSEVKSTMSGASHSGQGVELAWACAPPLANAVALPNAWLL